MSAHADAASAPRDREVLVRACIDVADQVASDGMRERLVAALVDAGVVPDAPVGQRFDPARHEAAGLVPTTESSLHNTIAVIERPGWVDRGRRLRLPRVLVHRFEASAARVGP